MGLGLLYEITQEIQALVFAMEVMLHTAELVIHILQTPTPFPDFMFFHYSPCEVFCNTPLTYLLSNFIGPIWQAGTFDLGQKIGETTGIALIVRHVN